MRRLVVDLTVPRDPKVVFEGGYINKVELEAVLRGIRKAHKKLIYEYRRDKIIADYEARKLKEEKDEVKNGTDSQSTAKSRESEGVSGAKPSTVDGSIDKVTSSTNGDGSAVKGGQGAGYSGEGSNSGGSPSSSVG